jgi:hypothetical protein
MNERAPSKKRLDAPDPARPDRMDLYPRLAGYYGTVPKPAQCMLPPTPEASSPVTGYWSGPDFHVCQAVGILRSFHEEESNQGHPESEREAIAKTLYLHRLLVPLT